MATFPRSGLSARIESIELTNFLSFKHALIELDDFTAFVGPNASGKSNIVTAFKLLREISAYGLPTAISRRGGFDQLRHRSRGRPYDPAIRIGFRFDECEASFYELRFSAVAGKRYVVKSETALVRLSDDMEMTLESDGARVRTRNNADENWVEAPVAPGQSAISAAAGLAGFVITSVLNSIQTVEINPAKVRDLQEPSSLDTFEPDGSNTATLFDNFDSAATANLVAQLSAIVPGIETVDVQAVSDRLSLRFGQRSQGALRFFTARNMSDGTLRAFSILVALLQHRRPQLLIVEEPEIAIHLGALRDLVEVLRQQSDGAQIAITTHSADIVDELNVESLRVVSSHDGESHVGNVADHNRVAVVAGLVTPGMLMRADALDAAR